ncbi:MAG: hypothetical protein PHW13_09405 [Methylococcales bacterium]|nr:hypothetical protein [Methylococcales bacterium]
MSPFRFVVNILVFAAMLMAATFSLNYIIDPYSVFGSRFFPIHSQPQERYLKIEYLKEHKEFNTFLIGNSRVGGVRTEDVDNAFKGAKTYNLTMASANEWYVEQYIDWLVKNMPKLSHVIVQVDWPYYYGPDKLIGLIGEVHPDISGRSKTEFLMDYLFFYNIDVLENKIKSNTPENIAAHPGGYDFTKGYPSKPSTEAIIDADCEKYVKNQGSFGETYKRPKLIDPVVSADTLAAIARYKSLLDKKNVRLTIFLTPRNHVKLGDIDLNLYEKFLKGLANITDFYNFMYYNELTMNNCNYYESSHYRSKIGKLIADALAEKSDNNSPYYQYVTRSNIETHLAFIKDNFLSNRSQ